MKKSQRRNWREQYEKHDDDGDDDDDDGGDLESLSPKQYQQQKTWMMDGVLHFLPSQLLGLGQDLDQDLDCHCQEESLRAHLLQESPLTGHLGEQFLPATRKSRAML